MIPIPTAASPSDTVDVQVLDAEDVVGVGVGVEVEAVAVVELVGQLVKCAD